MAASNAAPAINGLRLNNSTAEEAHRLLVSELEQFGTALSPEHSEGLRKLEYTYIHTALGINSGRTAWPLAVGAGKTESIAAFAAVTAQRRQRPVSIMVAQNTIEALCKLKRRMIELGVPAEEIGLIHSKRYAEEHREACMALDGPNGFASEPSIENTDDPSNYRVLLLSHELLKTRQDIHEFNRYRDAERDLVVWDESLLKSSGRTMDLTEVRAALGAANAFVDLEENPEAAAALKFVNFCLDELEAKLEEDAPTGEPVTTVSLPEKTDSELEDWSSALASVLRSRRDDLRILQQFLRMSQERLRVVHLKKGAAIQYDLLIPDSLKRIVVLDASYNVRELIKTFDQHIDVVDDYAAVKDFSAVTANHLRHGGGRSTVDPALRQSNSPLLRTIVERIKGYPEDKGVIIFTYKPKPREERRGTRSHADIIRSALRREGLDVDAKLANGKPRFVWLTWGQELGLSDFAYCEHVMLVGIYRKSAEQYAMSIAGQLENLEAPEAGDAKIVRQVEVSEVFHALYQAMGRGSCRVTKAGTALPMQLDWIGVEDFPEEYWAEAAPGIQLGDWSSKHLEPSRVAKQAGDLMVRHLESLGAGVEYVSSRQLSRALSEQMGRKLERQTLRRAKDLAMARVTDWTYQKDRQGWVRSGPFDPVP